MKPNALSSDKLPAAVKIRLVKLVLDKLLALVLLIVTAPVVLLIALAVKVGGLTDRRDRGPVFYLEQRVSEGRPFNLVKFRIFRLEAVEQIRAGRITKDIENAPENLTRIGRVLKKYGVDELPQLYPILKGEMSFVGPRPKPVREYERELGNGVYRGLIARAGLSGPAQILKGTVRTYEQEVATDYDYIEKCRTLPWRKLLRLDLSILCATLRVLSKGPDE